jgi:Zn-dependent protease
LRQGFVASGRPEWYDLTVMDDIILRLATGLPGFLLAIVCHEAAHAFMALKFGDDTAKMSGRLSLNPAVHYDLLGTVIFPMVGLLAGGVMFGWARPVPVDPRRFKNVRSGVFWVSFAGPLANIILAVISAFLLALMVTWIPSDFYFHAPFREMLKNSLMINLVLAVFNLIPFPPLDGSKMVSTFLDYEAARRYEDLQRFSFVFILILWFTNIFSYLMMPAMTFGNGLVNFFIRILGSFYA